MQICHLVQNTILSFCLINEELNPNRTVLRYDSTPFPTIWYPGTAETLSDHSPSPCVGTLGRLVPPDVVLTVIPSLVLAADVGERVAGYTVLEVIFS